MKMQQPTRVPAIDGVCLPAAGGRTQNAIPLLSVTLITVVLLVDRGADPALALGSLVAIMVAVGRLARG
jgi:hypothetical protein